MSDQYNPNSRLVDQLKVMAKNLRKDGAAFATDLGADLIDLAINALNYRQDRIAALTTERDAAQATIDAALTAAGEGKWNAVRALLGGAE